MSPPSPAPPSNRFGSAVQRPCRYPRPRRARSATRSVELAKQLQLPQSGLHQTVIDIHHAKSMASQLKLTLSQLDPWSREAEFQRQNARRQYMAHIFSNSPSPSDGVDLQTSSCRPYAMDALNLLWLDTSHAVINIYRQKVAAIDKAVEEQPKLGKAHNRRSGNRRHLTSSQQAVGPVARRKVLHHFRSFLSSEDLFWKSLINRLVNHFCLAAAQPCLQALKINHHDILGLDPGKMHNPHTDHLPDSGHPPSTQLQPAVSPTKKTGDRARSEKQKTQVSEGTLLVHKALICYGDLTRYRELYNQPSHSNPNHNPCVNHKFHSGRRANERDWSMSYECYNQARILIPGHGNPYNQLAVLSSYIPDVLGSVYHYYLALCAKEPFQTAGKNLCKSFTKALERWSRDSTSFVEVYSTLAFNQLDSTSRDKILCLFEAEFVALHAMLYTHSLSLFEQISAKNCADMVEYIRQRALSPELVLRMTVICMAAVMKLRSSNPLATREQCPAPRGEHPLLPFEAAVRAELLATTHLLHVSTSIISVAREELASAPECLPHDDLSQKISAVLRRILPTLRVISKWLLGGHLNRSYQIKKRVEVKTPLASTTLHNLDEAVHSVICTYKQFLRFLKQHFPAESLPSLDATTCLEEDVELAGFPPVSRGLSKSKSLFSKAKDHATRAQPCEDRFMATKAVHPNEEHLMRLADLQMDSTLMRLDDTSVPTETPRIHDTSGPSKPPVSEASVLQTPCARQSGSKHVGRKIRDNIDLSDELPDYWLDDEDPVEMAMRAVVAQQVTGEQPPVGDLDDLNGCWSTDRVDQVSKGDDEDEGEDEVVYSPRGAVSPGVFAVEKPVISCPRSDPSRTGVEDKDLRRPIDPPLKTAADLLESMTKKAESSPDRERPSASCPSSSRLPGLPSGWASLAIMSEMSAARSRKVSVETPQRHGSRTPSMSLPKPAEGSLNTNIWSTPRSSMSSSSPLLFQSNGTSKPQNQQLNELKGSDGARPRSGGGVPSRPQISSPLLPQWSISDVFLNDKKKSSPSIK